MTPWAKVLPYALAILLLQLLGVVLLIQSAGAFPSLWGMALLAYTLGMRHAFDADPIAAIDNAVSTTPCGGSSKRSAIPPAWAFSLRWGTRASFS